MGRILGNGGTPITVASIASINYAIRDLTAGSTTSTGTLTPGAVLFNDLQVADPRWTKDTERRPGADGRWGYNFLATLAATLFTAYDLDTTTKVVTPHRYQVDVRFVPASGEPFVQPFAFTPVPVYTS